MVLDINTEFPSNSIVKGMARGYIHESQVCGELNAFITESLSGGIVLDDSEFIKNLLNKENSFYNKIQGLAAFTNLIKRHIKLAIDRFLSNYLVF